MLRLHWIVNRKMLLQLTPMWGLWLLVSWKGLTGADDAAAAFPTIAFAFANVLMLIVTFQGLNPAVEPFLAALPIRRSRFVTAAYVAPLVAGAVGLLTPFTFAWGAGLASRIPPGSFGIAVLLYGLLATGLFVFLPLRFRLGSPAAPSIFVGIVVTAGAVHYFLRGFQDGLLGMAALANAGVRCLDHPLSMGLPALAGLLLLGFGSHAYACRAYAKRRF